ncbi:hypothetical protein [Holophaga foetida]|uniref:hypothetical protein n=1 Tax=Holophaga foetida TaxID=35839 RepID=UPI000247464E|nr:hypothetical protein [Holophaga foetida]
MNQSLFLPEAPMVSLGNERKAALLLHSLGEEDRAWLLGQVDTTERHSLERMLQELQELGIPEDPGIIGEVIAQAPLPLAAPVRIASEANDWEAVLREADPAILERVLRDDPPGVTARLLLMVDWPWQERFMECLGALRRHQVTEQVARFRSGGGASSGDCLKPALLAAVGRRLRQEVASSFSPGSKREAEGERKRKWFSWRALPLEETP